MGALSLTDPWRFIENPVTGETVEFIESSPDRTVARVTFPPGSTVVVHQHPGIERFDVKTGVLTLTVDGTAHTLAAGETFAVHQEWHFPANRGDRTAVVVVTVEGSPPGNGAFFERGIRGIFGLCRDGLVTASGPPKDLLVMALLTENGQYRQKGLPAPFYNAAMTVLGRLARRRGKAAVLEQYWPPDLERPPSWKAQ